MATRPSILAMRPARIQSAIARSVRSDLPERILGGGGAGSANGPGVCVGASTNGPGVGIGASIATSIGTGTNANNTTIFYRSISSSLNDGLKKPQRLPTNSLSRRSFSLSPTLIPTLNESMDDEYGDLTSEGYTFTYPGDFPLESGEIIPKAKLRYMTYGTLNKERDNVLVVCHALTGNASLHSWWGDLLGPGQAFDTSKYFVVSANILGSCYGSTGPASSIGSSHADIGDDTAIGDITTSKASGRVYGMDFPDVSVQDTVRLQMHMLQDELNVNSVKCVIGGSFGGMQAVEFAAQGGSIGSPFAVDDSSGNAVPFIRSVVPIGCGAAHTAWQIAISEVQRQAIYADPKWNRGNPSWDDPPLAGLSVARQIGMVSYRTAKGYEDKFGRVMRREVTTPYGAKAPWEVKSYLEYQGFKFQSRFDPITYVKLTEQMDSHDVGRNRGGKRNALTCVKIPALVLGIDSDLLYPLHEQEELAGLFPSGELKVIKSDAGHDGFLLEQEQVAQYISDFLAAHD